MNSEEYKDNLIETLKIKEFDSQNSRKVQIKNKTLEEILLNQTQKNCSKNSNNFEEIKFKQQNMRKSDDLFKTNFYQQKPENNQSIYAEKFYEKTEASKDYNKDIIGKKNNAQKTVISEYSNAIYNNRVFVNPRFLSC